MKFKKLYSKILWRDSFTVALGIIASIETLFAITDFGLKDFSNGKQIYKIPAPVFLYLLGYVENKKYNE